MAASPAAATTRGQPAAARVARAASRAAAGEAPRAARVAARAAAPGAASRVAALPPATTPGPPPVSAARATSPRSDRPTHVRGSGRRADLSTTDHSGVSLDEARPRRAL